MVREIRRISDGAYHSHMAPGDPKMLGVWRTLLEIVGEGQMILKKLLGAGFLKLECA